MGLLRSLNANVKRAVLTIHILAGRPEEEDDIVGENLKQLLIDLFTNFAICDVELLIQDREGMDFLEHIISCIQLCPHVKYLDASLHLRETDIEVEKALISRLVSIEADITLKLVSIKWYLDASILEKVLESGHVRSLDLDIDHVEHDPYDLPMEKEPSSRIHDFCVALLSFDTRYLRSLSLCAVERTKLEPLWDVCMKLPCLLDIHVREFTMESKNGKFLAFGCVYHASHYPEEYSVLSKISKEMYLRRRAAKYWNPQYYPCYSRQDRKTVHTLFCCQMLQRTLGSSFSLLPIELMQLILSYTIDRLIIRAKN